MFARPQSSGRRRLVPAVRPHLERLEERFLLSTNPFPGPVRDDEDTIDRSRNLGQLPQTPLVLRDTIGDGAAPSSDVDWYRFTLDRPSQVELSAESAGTATGPTLSLYNEDLFDFGDLYNPLGNRLLVQATDADLDGAATISRPLAPGTYFVAVSGAGNLDFHPYLKGSGYPGASGDYLLRLAAADLGLSEADGPVVLAATPGQGQAVESSPLVVRVNFSTALDPQYLIPGETVRLFYDATGVFGDGDVEVPLFWLNPSTDGTELQLTPATALAPGFYQVWLAGDVSHPFVLTDFDGDPLGKRSPSSDGQDATMTFEIRSLEGGLTSDDEPATAHDLGELIEGELVRRRGTIGDDPAYDFFNPDPYLANPAADVDLYHFRITGPGRFALTAETFAGRIGSPLDPGLSLFRVDAGGQLQLVAVNDNSLNDREATNFFSPLFTDAVLFAGLTAGDYYLAVSGTGNVPNEALGLPPGVDPIFDPTRSHSGLGGFTTGDYVLNVQVIADDERPTVTAVSIAEGATLDASPTTFTVQFDESVNFSQLLDQTVEPDATPELDAIFFEGIDQHPRLLSYDAESRRATFLLLDPLPNGPAALHLSGALGLADLAGNPLVGSDFDGDGDHVVRFEVAGPERGTGGNGRLWRSQEPNDSRTVPQAIGVLFPKELQYGVILERVPDPTRTDTSDFFEIEVLQEREYSMRLRGLSGGQFAVFGADALPLTGLREGTSDSFRFRLAPGKYVIQVSGWTVSAAPTVGYTFRIILNGAPDNPPALTFAPAPAIRLRLADPTTPATPPDPTTPTAVTPPVTPPTLSPDLPPTFPTDLPLAETPESAPFTPVSTSLLTPTPSPSTSDGSAGVKVYLANDLDTSGILLTRLSGRVVLGDEEMAEVLGPDRVVLARSELRFPMVTLVLASQLVNPPLDGPQAELIPHPERESTSPEQAGRSVPETPNPPLRARSFDLDHLPAEPVSDLSALASLSPLRSTGVVSLPGEETSADSPAERESSHPLRNTSRILLAVTSACAALGLMGWCAVRPTSAARKGKSTKVNWADEDSTFSSE